MMGYCYLFLVGTVFGVNLLSAFGPLTWAVLVCSSGWSQVSARCRWRSSAGPQQQAAGSYLGAGL